MMLLLRRILQTARAPSTALALVMLTGLVFLPFVHEARACWNIVLIECFEEAPDTTWPWQTPPGSNRWWRRNPNSTTQNCWGFQHDIYSTAMCPDDDQSLWCIGGPPGNDPEYDLYNSGLDTYLTYGPLNLSQAVAARAIFYLYNESEPGHDSIYWGAATSYTLSTTNMNIAGSYADIMQTGFELRVMDLAQLRNAATGQPVSMLGEPAVYLFWRFKADNNTTVDLGAFVDNVEVAWDDGGVDVQAASFTLLNPDSSIAIETSIGDTVMGVFRWATCAGGGGIYPPFYVIATVDGEVIFDREVADGHESMYEEDYTIGWVLNTPGDHVVRCVVDTLGAITEVNENNNVVTFAFHVAPPNLPPTFVWVSPGTDTVWADTVAMIRWECYDSEEEASVLLYSDNDTVGCFGSQLPGGIRVEMDGPDSLSWNTRTLLEGQVYWLFVRLIDTANDVCRYAPYPIVIRHGSATPGSASAVPAHFYLEQNSPNPFNPATEIRYGVAAAGHVRLEIWDVLGRCVTVLHDGMQAPGTYSARFDGSMLPSGLYFCTLRTPEGSLSRKMMLLK